MCRMHAGAVPAGTIEMRGADFSWQSHAWAGIVDDHDTAPQPTSSHHNKSMGSARQHSSDAQRQHSHQHAEACSALERLSHHAHGTPLESPRAGDASHRRSLADASFTDLTSDPTPLRRVSVEQTRRDEPSSAHYSRDAPADKYRISSGAAAAASPAEAPAAAEAAQAVMVDNMAETMADNTSVLRMTDATTPSSSPRAECKSHTKDNKHGKSSTGHSPLTLQSPAFCVQPGQLVGVCGEVGCGKSSLLAALLGELQPIPPRDHRRAADAAAHAHQCLGTLPWKQSARDV